MNDELDAIVFRSSFIVPPSSLNFMFLLQANTTALYSLGELQLLAPELILTICACVVLVMEVVLPYKRSRLTGHFALVALFLAGASLFAQWYANAPLLPLTGFY